MLIQSKHKNLKTVKTQNVKTVETQCENNKMLNLKTVKMQICDNGQNANMENSQSAKI